MEELNWTIIDVANVVGTAIENCIDAPVTPGGI
jgi:hypothetical protein